MTEGYDIFVPSRGFFIVQNYCIQLLEDKFYTWKSKSYEFRNTIQIS